MLDKLPIKATASVEKKTSCGFLCRHCVCKSLKAHDLLTVSGFQLAKWCKVIGLHALTTTLPPSLCAIFLPPSCSDRERSKPGLHQPFPAEGQQVQSGFMRSLLPPRAGSVIYSCLHHGERFWQWEKANPLHSLGHQRSHGWSGRGAVLPVSNTLNLVAAFCAGRGLTLSAENCHCITWGQTEVRVSCGVAGVPAAAALQPLRGRPGQRTATRWAHLVCVWCHSALWGFWEKLKEEKNSI